MISLNTHTHTHIPSITLYLDLRFLDRFVQLVNSTSMLLLLALYGSHLVLCRGNGKEIKVSIGGAAEGSIISTVVPSSLALGLGVLSALA